MNCVKDLHPKKSLRATILPLFFFPNYERQGCRMAEQHVIWCFGVMRPRHSLSSLGISTTQPLSTLPSNVWREGMLLYLESLSPQDCSSSPSPTSLPKPTLTWKCIYPEICPEVKSAWSCQLKMSEEQLYIVDTYPRYIQMTSIMQSHFQSLCKVCQPRFSVSRFWKTSPSSLALKSTHLETT